MLFCFCEGDHLIRMCASNQSTLLRHFGGKQHLMNERTGMCVSISKRRMTIATHVPYLRIRHPRCIFEKNLNVTVHVHIVPGTRKRTGR